MLTAQARAKVEQSERQGSPDPVDDLYEQYYLGYITYRDLSKQRGLLRTQSLIARILRYLSLASKTPESVG